MIKRPIRQFYARDFHLELGHKTWLMGILNCSPDSFSNDGKKNVNDAVRQALKFCKDGADIIDVGGQSTRPGAKAISVDEEIKRVIPVITALISNIKVPISIDSYQPKVIKLALQAGASIVNTVRGVNVSTAILKSVKDFNAGIVLMHSRGTSRTMQRKVTYNNLVKDIIKEIKPAVEKCLDLGIKKDKIIIDPGIGFAKTVSQNIEIINSLNDLHVLGCGVLIGTSRKSFIGKIIKQDVDQRIFGTAATVTASILNGAHIIRVHDVHQMKEVALMTDAILNPRDY